MRVTIKLFGPEATAAGRRELPVEFDAAQATCEDLRGAIAQQHPDLADQLTACRFAVNHAFADESTRISETDEIALIGQVSGG